MNREQEIVARSHAFREEYRENTPGWYRGEMHLAFTLCFTVGAIVYSAKPPAITGTVKPSPCRPSAGEPRAMMPMST